MSRSFTSFVFFVGVLGGTMLVRRICRWLRTTIAGGWQVNGLLSIYSGSPFTVTASDTLSLPGSNQRADQIKPSVAILGDPASYFDPLAYAPVTGARFGTSGYDSLRGPGTKNLDFSLYRTFKIT